MLSTFWNWIAEKSRTGGPAPIRGQAAPQRSKLPSCGIMFHIYPAKRFTSQRPCVILIIDAYQAVVKRPRMLPRGLFSIRGCPPAGVRGTGADPGLTADCGRERSTPWQKNRFPASSGALQILECFTDNETEWTLKALVEQLGLPTTTVFRQLSTLTDRQYLEQDPIRKSYRVGPRLLQLSSAIGGPVGSAPDRPAGAGAAQ